MDLKKEIKKWKRRLEKIALISLFFDVCIAMLTLVGNNPDLKGWSYTLTYETIQGMVNWGLTAIILLSGFIFLVIVVLFLLEKREEKVERTRVN